MSLARKNKITAYYNDFFPMIVNTLYGKLGNRQDAEDIAHELFIDFINKIDDIEHPRAWLLGAIRLKVMEFWRKDNKPEEDIHNVLNDVTLTFTNGFRDARIIINSIIEDPAFFKNAAEAQIFDMVAIKCYTLKEAAEIMGLTRRKLQYCYRMIAKRLLYKLREQGIREIEDLL